MRHPSVATHAKRPLAEFAGEIAEFGRFGFWSVKLVSPDEVVGPRPAMLVCESDEVVWAKVAVAIPKSTTMKKYVRRIATSSLQDALILTTRPSVLSGKRSCNRTTGSKISGNASNQAEPMALLPCWVFAYRYKMARESQEQSWPIKHN